MAFRFNPFTGNFDDVADVAEKLEASSIPVTDDSIVRFDGTTGTLVQDSLILIDDSGNLTGAANVTLSGNIDVATAGAFSIAASAGANNVTIGGSTSTVVVPGNLQVDGTTTSVNSTTLDVTDANITVNNGGNQASADNTAGLTVEMSDATDATLIYESTLASRFKIGDVGSESEILTAATDQTITGLKTITRTGATNGFEVDHNGSGDALAITQSGAGAALDIGTGNLTISNAGNVNTSGTLTLSALTADRALITNGSSVVSTSATTSTELGFLSGVTSSVQTQLNNKEDAITTLPIAKGGTNSSTALNDNRVMISSSGAIVESAAITASRALASDANGLPVASTTTSAELDFVSGVTSSIQDQLNDKIEITALFSVNSISGTATLTANETYIVDTSSSTATLTLPAASANAFVRIKDNGNSFANNITVNTPGAETIDGETSYTIDSNYESVSLVSDGANWFIL